MNKTQVGKHILALNGSPDVLDLMKNLLEEEGYRVTAQAYASKTTMEILNSQPDLIILDYMWGTDDLGWSLLEMLKLDPQTRSIPIIICTGAIKQVEPLRLHFEEMGIRVVIKPFDIDVLVREIQIALDGVERAED